MVSGRASMIRVVASSPLMPGRLMSINTSWGRRSSAAATASSPGGRLGDDLESGRKLDDGSGDVPERGLVVHDQHSDGRGCFDHSLLGLHLIMLASARAAAQRARPHADGGASPPRPRPGTAGRPSRVDGAWGSSESPSLAKSELMCFSTARSESPSASPTAALFLPCAISASTSRSRGVRWVSGDVRARPRAATSTSTTLGSMTEPPRSTSRIAAAS